MNVEDLRGRRATDRSNRVSIGDLLERPSWAMPEKIALSATSAANETGSPHCFSYREADLLANRLANGIRELGLSAGDICLMVCDNSAEGVLTKIGLAKAGIVVAPINPALDPDVVRQIIKRIHPSGVIMDHNHERKFSDLFSELKLKVLFSIRTPSHEPVATHRYRSFKDFVAEQSSAEPSTTVHGDDIWQLLFTSGSTSIPKAVMTSHINSYMSATAWLTTLARGVRVAEDTTFGVGLPIIYHVGDALVYGTFLNGGTVVIDRQPTAESMAKTISTFKVTTLWGGMPTFLRSILKVFEEQPNLTATSLQTIMCGWAPLDEELFQDYQELVGHEVFFCQLLGQTEVVVAHRFWPNEHRMLFHENPSTNFVGLPHPLLAARMKSQTARNDINIGKKQSADEMVYRSPALSPGYYNDSEATRNAFHNGWFHSGDSFTVGGEGQRIMVDRLKDIIKSGGENVSSAFVESILMSHPEVIGAAVVANPDERWGEAVTAVVILETDVSITEKELIGYCKQRLANFEVPKKIHFVDQLPTTVGGKLQKNKVREFVKEIEQK